VNSALEDVCVLEQQLFEASAGNLSQALPAFEQQRLPDSAALVKLVQVSRYTDYHLMCLSGCTSKTLGLRVACGDQEPGMW
jgi:2-polyprenyl-6-methoxyphenol hydroxylase-like FAD-dependent oxidoreductase